MNNRAFNRKVAYLAAIALLLVPIAALSQPAALNPKNPGAGSPGGTLSRLRTQYNLAQAELGEIDPASETMKLSTLGLRGVAANILWGWANYYKKIEDWDKLEMTVNQIIRLQPNFVEVWDFQAHNLSYNVSVEFDDYRMRYEWVKKGIRFLVDGTHYNRDEPGLLSELGWFTGQKVGRADEQKQFRRLFRKDHDFHKLFRENGVEVDTARGPEGDPDNWLVARLWYNKAVDAVTYSGKPIRGRTPLLFYSGGPMSQINASAAMQKDGHFFETALLSWRRGLDEWFSFGNRELPT
ncbi:MAG TPA: IRE (iron responsive element), partial [Pirellulales bacterium]